MFVRQLYLKPRKATWVAALLVLSLQVPSAWARNSSAGDLYYLAQKSYYQFMKSPEKQKFRHHWENVIRKFSKVMKTHPKSSEAYKAAFTAAKLYKGMNGVSKNSKDLDQALHYYKKVFRDFSSGRLTDDALFESAEIYRNKNELSSAAGIYKTIFEKYPKGDQAKKARLQYQKLAFISTVQTAKKQSVSSRSAKSKPVVLKKEMEPKIAGKTESLSSAKKKRVSLGREKRAVKQSLAVKPGQQEKAKARPQSSRRIARAKKKVVEKKPAKKRFVTRKVKLSPKSRTNITRFPKGKGGYLYLPSSGAARNLAPLIVVDAGHGGKDQGAKSKSGIHEKDVNLTIARHVKTILVNRFKYRVVMTRKNDMFIPLKERSKIANNRNADLFVSIHANAAKRKSAHGIETYFLGTSNNDRALATAARENGELVGSVKDNQVQEILASLITTTKINDSSRLAGTVQENLFRSSRKKFRDLKNLGVKEGPFYVLHGADMPSILVEVGFLTNRKEARMLSKPNYLYRLASSIAEGIHKYLQDKGPSI